MTRAPDARQKLQAAESEASFASRVEDLLTRFGWHWCHFRPARTGRTYIDKNGEQKEVWNTPLSGDPGMLDIIAVRAPRLLFIELKATNGNLTAEEAAWAEELMGCCGAEVLVLWPESHSLEELVGLLRW